MTASILEIEGRARELREEAGRLLEGTGLRALLGHYGSLTPVGSYALDLMVWRDLDLELIAEGLAVSEFFKLGGAIAALLGPERMHYRDEFMMRTPGLPVGRYWGIYLPGEDGWKIDLWVMDHAEQERRSEYARWLAANLTEARRRTILQIKSAFWNQPGYRTEYSSTDIYDAVISDGIQSVDAFRAYLAAKGKL